MQYQLLTPLLPNIESNNLVERVFINRGIAPTEIKHYMTTNDEDLYDPSTILNIKDGATMLIKHIAANDKIFIQVDSDCDGYTSSAILINYLNMLFPNFTQHNISYRIHDGKQHGLIPSTVPEGVKLVILPDSSSNDYEQHAEMAAKGIDVLVIDHHQADGGLSHNACVINNQLCDYPNKTLSGAGMVYKFCCYIDSLLGKDCANNFVDLAALGIIADMMDLRNCETRRIIEKGLTNLRNPFMVKMCATQNFSIQRKGGLMPFTISWFIAPMVNATVRTGMLEHKKILFESMLDFKAYEQIPSTKRGCKGQFETRVEQACRNCGNLKNKQNDARDQGVKLIKEIIERDGLDKDPVIIVKLQPEYNINKSIVGLIANIIAADYQRPCAILNRTYDDDTGEVSWEGSARGNERSFIKDFRGYLLESNAWMDYAEGHENAFGVGISDKNLSNFCNKIAFDFDDMDIDYSDTRYFVDAIYTYDDFKSSDIIDVGGLKEYWGKGLEEPLIAINRVKLTPTTCQLMAKGTVKIHLPNNVDLIKFGVEEEEYNSWVQPSKVTFMNIVGMCNQNVWNGKISAQIEIKDFEITGTTYDF